MEMVWGFMIGLFVGTSAGFVLFSLLLAEERSETAPPIRLTWLEEERGKLTYAGGSNAQESDDSLLFHHPGRYGTGFLPVDGMRPVVSELESDLDAHTVEVTDPKDQSTLTLSQLWVTINRISIHREDEGWLTVYDSTAIDPTTGTAVGPKVYDLLTLHSTADLISLASIPAGTYQKVRFELETSSGANTFCTGIDPDPCADPNRFDLTVPSGKVDLDLHPHLTLADGETVNLVFDFIPDQSIQITETGEGRFLLRPEIHTGILGAPGFEEMDLEEFEGTIESAQCDSTPPILTLTHRHGLGVVNVDLSQADLYDENGSVVTCADLTVGSEVKVKGTLQSDGNVLAEYVESEGGDEKLLHLQGEIMGNGSRPDHNPVGPSGAEVRG